MSVTGTNITLTTRTAKGSALTHAELDANQTGLKTAVESHSHNEFATALGADDNYMTDAEKTKLAGIATGAEVNVQADWNASTGDAVILNKPSIPSISGLLNEAAHDALDHTGLTGVPAAYSLPTASTTVLGGVKVDGTTVLISDGVISSTGGSGGGVTDHGLLTGLSDDDHGQYYNQTRGDARYSQTSHNHGLNNLTEKSYNSLTDKPSIPSVAGLLDETAHDALDHAGLTGVLSIGTTGTTACAGNDSRLSDSRTPTAHSHTQSDVTDLLAALAAKQATLVSGTNIKTINGQSLLGSGDVAASSGGASVQQATVTLAQNASTNITATAVIGVSELHVISVATSANAISGGDYSGYSKASVFDGSTTTFWVSSQLSDVAHVAYIGQAGLTATIETIEITNYTGANSASFMLQWSSDGTSWADIQNFTANKSDDAVWSVVVPNYTHTYPYQLRMLASENTASTWALREIKMGARSYNRLTEPVDYTIRRGNAIGEQTHIVTRMKAEAAEMVIDYI